MPGFSNTGQGAVPYYLTEAAHQQAVMNDPTLSFAAWLRKNFGIPVEQATPDYYSLWMGWVDQQRAASGAGGRASGGGQRGSWQDQVSKQMAELQLQQAMMDLENQRRSQEQEFEFDRRRRMGPSLMNGEVYNPDEWEWDDNLKKWVRKKRKYESPGFTGATTPLY